MKFVELTTTINNPCLVNLGSITDIHTVARGGCTIYFNGEQNHTEVKESLEEIQKIILAL